MAIKALSTSRTGSSASTVARSRQYRMPRAGVALHSRSTPSMKRTGAGPEPARESLRPAFAAAMSRGSWVSTRNAMKRFTVCERTTYRPEPWKGVSSWCGPSTA